MERPKLLIIDDEVELCQLLKEFFTQEGFHVDCSHDGEEGLVKAMEVKPDVILLDVRMPKKDGLFFLEKLRAFSQAGVIMVSAIKDQRILDQCKELGIADYITKPVDLIDLKTRVESTLHGYSSH